MGLTIIVVRILPQNHYLYIRQRCKCKCVKDIIRFRKHPFSLIFMLYCLIQFFIIGFLNSLLKGPSQSFVIAAISCFSFSTI